MKRAFSKPKYSSPRANFENWLAEGVAAGLVKPSLENVVPVANGLEEEPVKIPKGALAKLNPNFLK